MHGQFMLLKQQKRTESKHAIWSQAWRPYLISPSPKCWIILQETLPRCNVWSIFPKSAFTLSDDLTDFFKHSLSSVSSLDFVLEQLFFFLTVCFIDGLLTCIYSPMATCVQNNSWRAERGAEEPGHTTQRVQSQDADESLTPPVQRLNYSSLCFHSVLNLVLYFSINVFWETCF